MNILDKIINTKRLEVAQAKERLSMDLIEQAARSVTREVVSMRRSIEDSPVGIIAEFKRKSPSKGVLNNSSDLATVVAGYAAGGAAGISVLTDGEYFAGSLADLNLARRSTHSPLLRKDFMIDPYQICQARIEGADCILLIASALTPSQTTDLAMYAHWLGLEVLLEIHNSDELRYISPNVDIVGVNNRNLSTFDTDIARSVELAEMIPSQYLKISESGISDPENVKMLRRVGYRGFLMGENFMKESDPSTALKRFIEQISPLPQL